MNRFAVFTAATLALATSAQAEDRLALSIAHEGATVRAIVTVSEQYGACNDAQRSALAEKLTATLEGRAATLVATNPASSKPIDVPFTAQCYEAGGIGLIDANSATQLFQLYTPGVGWEIKG